MPGIAQKSSPNAGLNRSTAATPAPVPNESPASSSGAIQINFPDDFDLNLGIITSGVCAGEEAQAEFDANIAGKPPR